MSRTKQRVIDEANYNYNRGYAAGLAAARDVLDTVEWPPQTWQIHREIKIAIDALRGDA